MKIQKCACENSNVGIFFDDEQELWLAECQGCLCCGPGAISTIGAVLAWNEMLEDSND